MSVTFTIEANTTGAFTITCDDVLVATAPSYDAILTDRTAHMLVCEDCAYYGCYPNPVMDVSDDYDVNLANTNARMILNTIGIDGGEDLCGSAPADVFLGAVLLAMATDRDDTGVAAVNVNPGMPGATMIDCGLPAGYFADRFSALHALAAEAARLGRDITWA